MPVLLTSTSYFPPLLYLSECLKAEAILIEVHETYPKQTSRNHCNIAGPNGLQKLTVPAIKPGGNHTKTKDIRIYNHLPWQRLHLRSITTAYNKSPYLLFYQDQLQQLFKKPYTFLIDLNLEILQRFLEMLNVEKKISMTTGYDKHPNGMTDLRNELSAKNQGLSHPMQPYVQPFSDRNGFLPNMSVLDAIFCLGPDTKEYLLQIK